MPALVDARCSHACCVVRGGIVVIGATTSEAAVLGSVEMIAEGEGSFTGQPPLTCGRKANTVAIVVDESSSAVRHMLVLGGYGEDDQTVSMV
jgi:hypothetical protein